MSIVRLILLGGAMAAGTAAFGWWAVPVIGACWGAIAWRQRGAAVTAGLAGMIGWAALLMFDATRGPLGTLAQTLGGLFTVKAVGVYAMTLALPGLLAVTAAIVARSAAAGRR